jgi:biopolymer transport protein ExbD
MGAVPLLILVLLLLTVFIIITPAIPPLRLPSADSASALSGWQTTVIVDPAGRFWIADHPDPGPIGSADLSERLEDTFAKRGGQRRLTVAADPRTEYRILLDVVAVAQSLNLTELNLAVDCPKPVPSLSRTC